MKKIIIIFILVLTGFNSVSINAEECGNDFILNSTPDVESGNGGQDYVSEVYFWIDEPYEGGGTKPVGRYIEIYDWNGKHVEDVEPNYSGNAYNTTTGASVETATGIVDGTYTYVLETGEKGSFNVNHNIENNVYINLADFDNCDNTTDDSSYEVERNNLLQKIADSLSNIAESISKLVNNILG